MQHCCFGSVQKSSYNRLFFFPEEVKQAVQIFIVNNFYAFIFFSVPLCPH